MFTGLHASFNLRSVPFSSTIRRRRKAMGLTLEEVAERAQLSPNYLGSVELGRRDPSLSTVIAIARALKASAAELLGGAQELGPAGVEAGKVVDGLPAEVQETLLAFLRTLARRRR